jgi:hypothetical protein
VMGVSPAGRISDAGPRRDITWHPAGAGHPWGGWFVVVACRCTCWLQRCKVGHGCHLDPAGLPALPLVMVPGFRLVDAPHDLLAATMVDVYTHRVLGYGPSLSSKKTFGTCICVHLLAQVHGGGLFQCWWLCMTGTVNLEVLIHSLWKLICWTCNKIFVCLYYLNEH